MNRKEWLEVGRQSLYFVLAASGMVLLVGLVGLLDGKPLEGEKIIIILGLWLLMFSMFIGLSPFALDSKQKGMEYLLTLPYSRRRLLLIKFLPRLTALVLFFIAYGLLYGFMGNDAFGTGYLLLSLVYFSLFFISFSLSVIHENFIVQSIWAGVALCGYLAICLVVLALGISWKYSMPLAWAGFHPWQGLSDDIASLITAIVVFFLMLAPFVVSFFLAFKKFDLRPSRVFNRRQLLLFVPMLLLALAASLGVTRLVQKSSAYDEGHYYILENRHVLKTSWLGKLTILGENQRRRIDTKQSFIWDWNAFAVPGKLFLTADDFKNNSTAVVRLNLGDLSWDVVHRIPDGFMATHAYFNFHQYGQNLVFLQRGCEEAERPGMQSTIPLKSDRLDLVVIDMSSEKPNKFSYQSPLFTGYYQPKIFAHDTIAGREFWLIGGKNQKIIRIWKDGTVEDLGFSQNMPAYYGHLLLSRSNKSLVISRLLASGSETVKEIGGKFKIGYFLNNALDTGNGREIYIIWDKRIVRLDLNTLAIDDVGPERGFIWQVPPADFYYLEYEGWLEGIKQPEKKSRWRKIYRLLGNKMIFLKQLDFRGPDSGNVWMDKFGVTLRENGTTRLFAFPDLRELKFKNLN
jgi:hypothetical protein